MFLKGIWGAVFALALLASGCHSGPSAPSAVSLTEGAGLTPTDDINGLDAAVGADGAVHVVWQELLGEYADSRDSRLIYRSASGTPLRWRPPVALAAGRADTAHPQVVATPQGAHVFAGEHLHHWWLPIGGAPIRDLGNLLADDGPGTGRFDAAASKDGVLIIFSALGKAEDAALQAIRWTPAGPQAPVLIATFQDSRDTTPQLLRYSDRWIAFWANNALVDFRDPRDGMMSFGLKANVHMAVSLDEGASWGAVSSIASPQLAILGIAADSVAGAPVAFYASDGLYESSQRAGAWTPPLRIAGYDKGFFAGSTETTAVATTQCNGHTALAWVDARYRRSDRRPWNPLGGFPWGDDPDWDNNDLFVAINAPQSASAATALEPLRLTVDPSMTRNIALVAREGRLLVFRSGRARVRKAPYDEDAPPEVTQASVSCT